VYQPRSLELDEGKGHFCPFFRIRRQRSHGRVELSVVNVEGQSEPLIEVFDGVGEAVVFGRPRVKHTEVPPQPETELALERVQLERGPVSVNPNGLR
jgi:hypothetical protein